MKVLLNGKIYSNSAFLQAIVLEGARIKFIGSDREALKLAGENTEVLDLKGKLALPGFIDSHAHGGHFKSLFLDQIDLSGCGSVAEYEETIRKFIREHPDMDLYQGIGWLSPLFPDIGPAKEMLDAICDTKPIVLQAVEGHSLWVNSKAIELAGVTEDTESPMGGFIEVNEDGSLRGTFKDEAQGLIEVIVPETSVEQYKKAIRDYQRDMVRYGYTASCEMMMERGSNLHKAYQELAMEGELLIKAGMHYMVSPGDILENERKLRGAEYLFENKLIDGGFAKLFIDGVVEGGTAWLKEPYSNDPNNYGDPLWTDEQLFETCAMLDHLGYNLHFHVIGDAAVEQMIRAAEYVRKTNGPNPSRKIVAAHIQLADDDDIRRMAEAGICVSANPYWFSKDDIYYTSVERPLLGERADRQYPLKSLMDKGIVVSSGSDYAVTEEPNPLIAIKMGVERVVPGTDAEDPSLILYDGEQASLKQMVDSVTINGAYTMNIEQQTGSLEVGKLADLVVLSKNIFEIPQTKWLEAEVELTISEGQIVYRKGECENV